MSVNAFYKVFIVSALLSTPGLASAGLITTYTDRATFDATVGPTTLEDFTSSSHFPIPGGSLSSTTSFGTLSAGDIKAGATYSTPVGTGNYFNIDSGGGFPPGGFLDGFNPSDRDLTITYDPIISAFGFETNNLMPDFDITINFLSDPSYTNNFSGISAMSFFGFQSSARDIQSVVISGNNSSFGFAIDNHSFDSSAVPEPTTFALLGLGLAGVAFSRRRSKI